MPWHPVPRRAASAVLAVRLTELVRWFDLQSADFLCFIIRNLRYSLNLLSGFTSGEYHVIRVDLIVALRRTKGRGRRTLRSPPSPWNHACVVRWTPPHPPGVIRCGGALLLPRAWGNIGSLYPVLSLIPSSEYGLAFCVRACIVRVSVGVLGFGRTFFIIGGKVVRACGYFGFCNGFS